MSPFGSRALTGAAPALLVLVACLQVTLARSAGRLTPAKGGGFGLFSTVDKLNNRGLRVSVFGEDFRAQLESVKSEAFSELARDARALPNEGRLEATIQHLLEQDFGRELDGVGLEVWKLAFDPETLRVWRVLVAEHEGRRDG